MAVAAHVGRVSKDYAPFGYSIMEETTGMSGTGGGNVGRGMILIADDADCYIESISIANAGGTVAAAAAPNNLLVQVSTAPFGGARTVTPTWTAISTAVTSIGADWNHGATIRPGVSNPIVPQGQAVWIEVLPQGTFSAGAQLAVTIRYRRKA